ncbi:MAG: DUF4494 family protein [Paludibacteraceae bacterium]|nr:DUF4494 family protein [Paludibacteraceae bacterium]
MILYEVKIDYQRQTGEDNPGKVKETYLVEGLTPTDVEARLMDEITPFIFGGESEIKSCKKVQFFDIYPNPDGENWYKARVEMITVDGDKETRKAVSVLCQDNSVAEAVKHLQTQLNGLDCEIISVAKSPIIDFFRAVD